MIKRRILIKNLAIYRLLVDTGVFLMMKGNIMRMNGNKCFKTPKYMGNDIYYLLY